MPVLVKYERGPLTMAQIYAVRDYIARKRVRNDIGLEESGSIEGERTDTADEPDVGKDTSEENAPAVVKGPSTPPPPTAAEIREIKQNELGEISKELGDLEKTLEKLKQKKHDLFEEFKTLLNSEKEKKKQAEEKERQLQGFPSPFMAQLPRPGNVMSISPPFKHSMGLPGNKRSRSPSPPVVQIYNSSTSHMPAMHADVLQSSPGHTRPYHAMQSHNTFGGGVQRLPFQPMGNAAPAHSDNMSAGGHQYQQGFSSRDPHNHLHRPQVTPHTPPAPQTSPGAQRQLLEQRHAHEQQTPSFNRPPVSPLSSSAARSLTTTQQPIGNQASFGQQNMLPSQQQQPQTNEVPNQFSKDQSGLPHGHQTKRGNQFPNRPSRYY